MLHNDMDKVFMLEKAIEEKYGKEAIKSPSSEWNFEKEKKFQEQKESLLRSKKNKIVRTEIVNCNNCEKICLSSADKFYARRFKNCEMCYQILNGVE